MLPAANSPIKTLEFALPANTSQEPLIVFPFDSGQDSFILQDPAGVLWRVGIADSGLLQTTLVSVGIPITVVLDDTQQTASWELEVTTTGQLVTMQQNFNSTYPTFRWMGSVTGLSIWGLGVLTDGQLFTQSSPTALDESCIMGFIKVPSAMGTYQSGW